MKPAVKIKFIERPREKLDTRLSPLSRSSGRKAESGQAVTGMVSEKELRAQEPGPPLPVDTQCGASGVNFGFVLGFMPSC